MLHRLLVAAVAAVTVAAPALAQVPRHFPHDALRGTIAFGPMPEITLNGEPARLSPAARIHAQNNLLELPSTLFNRKAIVNYTVGIGGLVNEVWILRPDELAKSPWPTTADEASRWRFDPAAQTWSRR
ncbi:MAG TPA: hypothetical protein VLU41_04000 [Ideonella sp.]|nr:hypothetical protein [Ideonella sp.]